AEGADRGAPQGVQVAAAAEHLAELARDRAHVRARGAGHREGNEPLPRVVKVETRDPDLLGQRRDALALPGHLVELAPLKLLGGVGGRGLEEFAAKAPRRLFDLAQADARGVPRLAHGLALPVVGRRGAPEPDRSLVGLVHPGEETLEAGGSAGAEQQQARRHRIERAAVADPRQGDRLSDPPDDVVGGQAPGLVEEEEDSALERAGGQLLSFGGRTWASSSSTLAPRSSDLSAMKCRAGA